MAGQTLVCRSTSHGSWSGSAQAPPRLLRDGPAWGPLHPSRPGRSSLLLLLATSRPGSLGLFTGSPSPVQASANSPFIASPAEVPGREFPARTLTLHPPVLYCSTHWSCFSQGDSDCAEHSHGSSPPSNKTPQSLVRGFNILYTKRSVFQHSIG